MSWQQLIVRPDLLVKLEIASETLSSKSGQICVADGSMMLLIYLLAQQQSAQDSLSSARSTFASFNLLDSLTILTNLPEFAAATPLLPGLHGRAGGSF